jgi:hypothetical protein
MHEARDLPSFSFIPTGAAGTLQDKEGRKSW